MPIEITYRTHRRHGHLFQNRFKSILCQEDVYLLELVRYIHLNPIRAHRVSAELGVKPEEVWVEGKYRRIATARSLLCYWAVRELGVPMSSLSQKLGISIPSVSGSVSRGRRIAEAGGFRLVN